MVTVAPDAVSRALRVACSIAIFKPLNWFLRFYYIGTDEIPGFLLSLKRHIFIARSEDAIFIFHVDMGVAMATNMISQLKESFPLRRVEFYMQISSASIK